jgi:hypothetical protein
MLLLIPAFALILLSEMLLTHIGTLTETLSTRVCGFC